MRYEFTLLCAILLLARPAAAQHYRNFEITPDNQGGAYGTYGNQNFQFEGSSSGSVEGQIGGGRPGVTYHAPGRQGDQGATLRRCFRDGNGHAICENRR